MSNIIVYTQRVEIIESYNERRDCADQRIADFLSYCGFIPIPLPNNPIIVDKIINIINPCGIVLTGGNSLVKYGGNAPEKDETDKKLISIAIDKNIPLLGFCRGMQSILDYFGDELVKVDGHVAIKHMIINEHNESRLVNSYHNYACINNTSKLIKPLFKTNDGVIETIKHIKYPLIGIMWHPEREANYSKEDIELFKDLFGGKQ